MQFTQSEIVQLSTWFATHQPGELISVLALIPASERQAILDGTSTYDATAAINAAINQAHASGRATVLFNGALFNTSGGHIIYDDLHLIGLGMGTTTIRLIAGVPIDTSIFVTEFYHAGMAQTTPPSTGTFGWSVQKMTLDGNKQHIPHISTATVGSTATDATTITVTSTAGFTAPGRLRIGSELITFTGKTATTFTGCERGDYRTFPVVVPTGTSVFYFPLWGAVGLGAFGGQYLVDNVRIENMRNQGMVSAYDRLISGTHNYQNSRPPESGSYADLPDGDTHALLHDIEILNNQLINLNFLGPHDSHISHFTIVKDGDDLPGENYLFPVAGIYVGGTSNPDVTIDYGAGSQFSDGHVWGNHSYGIWQATGGVMWENVQSEGAHVQFRSSAGNAQGSLRLFGASGGRAGTGAWLESQADDLRLRVESHDYAGVVLGSMDGADDYGGGFVEIDGYTNNPSHTTLSAGITAVQTTIPYTPIVNGPGEANYLPYAHNTDGAGLVAFGVPFGPARDVLSVTIENEEIAYTSYDGANLLGCTRGINGTVALAHSAGKDVFGVLHLVRGQAAPSFDLTRGTVIATRLYNYEPIRTRQLESYLRRGDALTLNEKRAAFAVGAPAAVTDLATRHKFMVSVTETEPKNDYAVISTYGHMLRDTDAPSSTYHGIRSYLDSTFTNKTTKEVRAVTGEVNVRTVTPGVITDAVGMFAGAYTAAAASAAVTRLAALRTNLTHAGTGVVGTGYGLDIGTPTGTGVYTNLLGISVPNMGRAGTTLSKAIHITAQAGSTTNYALYSDGGENRLYSGAAGTIPLKIWGHFSQTASLLEFWNRDTNARMSYVDAAGAWNGVTGGGGGSVAWADVTGKPTTIAGFGITDAYTKTEADARYSPLVHGHAWADITGTPTTLAGYGITDAVAILTVTAQQTWAGPHRFNGSIGIGNDPSTTSYVEISPAFSNPSVNTVMMRAVPTITTTANSAIQFLAMHTQLIAAPATGTSLTSTNALRALYGVVTNAGAGTINVANAVFGQVTGNVAGGVMTTAYVLRASGPSLTNGSLITNLYGVYVAAQKITGVTTAYGVYQLGASDLNYFAGSVGMGQTAPTAVLHLKAGTASPGSAPLKFDAGTLLGTVENGTIEYSAAGFFYSHGGVRIAVGAATSVPWSGVTGTPTTVSGYGITDAAPLVHTHPDVIAAGASGFMTGADKTKLNLLTIPSAGTVALLGTANAFTTRQSIASNAHASLPPMAINFTSTTTVGLYAMLLTNTTDGGSFGFTDYASGGYLPTMEITSAGVAGAGGMVAGRIAAAQDSLVATLAAIVLEARLDTPATVATANLLVVRNFGAVRLTMAASGNVAIGTHAPTAVLHLKAGTASPGSAALKFTPGVFLTVAEAGAVGYNGVFALTESDATRRYIVQAAAATKVTGTPVADGYVVMRVNGVDLKVLTTA